MDTLRGKVAIITGGASGIGRATALLLAEEGAKVVLADINEPGGQETQDAIKARGGDALFLKTDVSKPVDIQELVGKTLMTYGGINIVHGNAAMLKLRPTIEELGEQEWRQTLDVNLTSIFLLARASFPMMGRGDSFIFTSSAAAYAPNPSLLAYVTSKAAVSAFARGLAALGQKSGVRVNIVAPEAVDTPLIREPFKDSWTYIGDYLLQPDDVAKAVRFLAMDDTVNGAEILVQSREGKVRYLRMEPPQGTPITVR